MEVSALSGWHTHTHWYSGDTPPIIYVTVSVYQPALQVQWKMLPSCMQGNEGSSDWTGISLLHWFSPKFICVINKLLVVVGVVVEVDVMVVVTLFILSLFVWDPSTHNSRAQSALQTKTVGPNKFNSVDKLKNAIKNKKLKLKSFQ